MNTDKYNFLLHLADTSLILGQRLGEWCGHGPVLEQDMAMTNISLDYIGRARLLFQYAAEESGGGATEDSIAYLRLENEYKNFLITEYPNTDFAFTVTRQFYLDAFLLPYYKELSNSSDKRLSEIATKTVKETAYHLKWSSEWMIRLGDGTVISAQKIQAAVESLWPYTGEFFQPTDYEDTLIKNSIAPNPISIQSIWDATIDKVFEEAKLIKPTTIAYQTGGKIGVHTEHLGFLLSDLQYLQRVYPGLEW